MKSETIGSPKSEVEIKPVEYYENVKDAIKFKSEVGELKYWNDGNTFTYMIKGDSDKCLIIRKTVKIGFEPIDYDIKELLEGLEDPREKHETIETWINFLFREHYNDIIDSKVFNDLIEPIEARNRIQSILHGDIIETKKQDGKSFDVDFTPDKDIVMDLEDYITKIKHYNKRGEVNNETPLLDGIIEDGEILEAPEENIEYINVKIKRKTSDNGLWIRTRKSEFYGALDKKGLILKHGYTGQDAISMLIRGLEIKGWLKKRVGYGIPGFYYYDDEIRSEYIETEATEDDLRGALITLEDYINDIYKNLRGRALYIFLHQLTAPYDYIRKQLNYKNVTGLLLTGESESGKTTIANATSMLYKVQDDYLKRERLTQDRLLLVHGGNVGTPSRYGHYLSSTTLPIVIDEAEDIYDKPELLNMAKQTLDSIIARTIMSRDGITAIETKAFTTPIHIMNEEPRTLRSYQGLIRREKIIRFEDVHRIKKDKKTFKEKWKVTEHGHYHRDSPIRDIWPIGAWTYKIIKEAPEILGENRIRTSMGIMKILYGFADLEWTESPFKKIPIYKPPTIETIKFNELIQTINYLKEKISNGWDRKTTMKITDVDYSETRDEVIPIEEKALNVAKGQIYPWIAYNEKQEVYIIDKGFKEALSDAKKIHISLPKLGEGLNNLIGSNDIKVKSIRVKGKIKPLWALVIPKKHMNEILNIGKTIKESENREGQKKVM
ncbi:MAG TPA: hypothetical protein VGD31_17350 [Sphingobacteriaceae bacterium]